MNGSREQVLLWTPSYRYLAEAMSQHLPYARLVDVEDKVFKDGTRRYVYGTALRAKDVVIVGSTHTSEELMSMYVQAFGAYKEGAKRITLVIPYFGNARQDRKTKPGEVVTSKAIAHMLSSLPRPKDPVHIHLWDLHQEGIVDFFDAHNVNSEHFYYEALILDKMRTLGLDNVTIAATDGGRAKWVQSYAQKLGVPPFFLLKERTESGTKIIGQSGDVRGRIVYMFDDMIDSGGTSGDSAEEILKRGALAVYGFASHGIFSDGAVPRLKKRGLFKRIFVGNSLPSAVQAAVYHPDLVETIPMESLLAAKVDC